MQDLKIVYFGTPDFSADVLEGLINKKLNIKTVVTKQNSPVSKIAQKYNISILNPDKLNEEFINKNPDQLTADLFIVFAYGKIIPQKLLEGPKLGAFNLHPSILPKYRGASPIQQAILEGETETGVTVMLMDEQMDHGPILAIEKFKINPDDTFLSLSKKMSHDSIDLLIETIQKYLQKKLQPKNQNHDNATFCKILKRDSGYFDITSPPSIEVLNRMIRAYYPWPGVWTKWNDKIVKFLPMGLIQMEGKKATDLKSFLNGYPSFPLKDLLAS